MVHRLLVFLGSTLAAGAYYLGIRTEVTMKNLEMAFVQKDKKWRSKIAKESYRNLGRVFAEMVYLRFASKKKIVWGLSISNPEVFINAHKKGRGLIAVSGHYANWEWMALAAAVHLDIRYHIVVKNIVTGAAESFLAKMRERTGNKLIPAGDVRQMFRILKSGGAVTLLADQSAPGESVRVPFMGIPTPTFEGPARLALQTRAELLFGICEPASGGKYNLTFTSIPFDDLQDTSIESVRELTSRHTAILESYIRKHPEFWLWQHRRWKNI